MKFLGNRAMEYNNRICGVQYRYWTIKYRTIKFKHVSKKIASLFRRLRMLYLLFLTAELSYFLSIKLHSFHFLNHRNPFFGVKYIPGNFHLLFHFVEKLHLANETLICNYDDILEDKLWKRPKFLNGWLNEIIIVNLLSLREIIIVSWHETNENGS